MSQFKELEEIVGKSEKLEVDGKEFEIFELSIKSILNIFKRIGKLNISFNKEMSASEVINLITNNFDLALELVAYASKSPVADVKSAVDKNQISLDGFTSLAIKSVEVNQDIFLSAANKLVKMTEEKNQNLNTQANSSPSKEENQENQIPPGE